MDGGMIVAFGYPPPLLDLSLFHQCCIYEERGRQQFSMRVDLAREQTERVQVSVSYDLGETADDFESFQVHDIGIPAGVTWSGIIVTATPRDDDVEEPEKRLTVTASATIGGETHTDTQVLKLIDNDAPDQATVVSLAVSAEGLVTWERGDTRVPGQVYLLRWVSGGSPPQSADSMDTPGYGKSWIEGSDCGAEGCEFQIPDFDAELHYLVQVRSLLGETEWEEVRHNPAPSADPPLTSALYSICSFWDLRGLSSGCIGGVRGVRRCWRCQLLWFCFLLGSGASSFAVGAARYSVFFATVRAPGLTGDRRIVAVAADS